MTRPFSPRFTTDVDGRPTGSPLRRIAMNRTADQNMFHRRHWPTHVMHGIGYLISMIVVCPDADRKDNPVFCTPVGLSMPINVPSEDGPYDYKGTEKHKSNHTLAPPAQ